jgi:hypothetical protein
VIISHKHKWVFVHNPKVAGTSVRSALAPYHDDSREFWHQGWFPPEDRVIDLAHMTADIWHPIVDPRYTSFGFVRHPYARFVSGLTEVMRRHCKDFAPDLRRFVMEQMTPANLRWDWRFIHLCPQHNFFFRGSKRVVDHVGRMENLAQDWAAITSLLGLNINLPHERVGAIPQHTLLEDPEVLNRINSLYLRDFQLFGYRMLGTVEASSHSERIAAIHDNSRFTFFTQTDLDQIQFTEGERISLRRRIQEEAS